MKPIAHYALCHNCNGHGWIPDRPGRPRTELCTDCLGKGCHLSADGRSILGLLGVAGLAELMPDT